MLEADFSAMQRQYECSAERDLEEAEALADGCRDVDEWNPIEDGDAEEEWT